MQTLSGPKVTERMLKLASSSYRPKEIIEAKREIEAKTREAETDAVKSGKVDYGRIGEIVNLKLRLDGLYCDWLEGKIS